MSMLKDAATSTIVALRDIKGNSPTELVELQRYLVDHLQLLMYVWWGVFFLTLAIVLGVLIYEMWTSRESS